MSSLTVPIPPDLSPACRAENTVPRTVPVVIVAVVAFAPIEAIGAAVAGFFAVFAL
jgi:hypothetical protein